MSNDQLKSEEIIDDFVDKICYWIPRSEEPDLRIILGELVKQVKFETAYLIEHQLQRPLTVAIQDLKHWDELAEFDAEVKAIERDMNRKYYKETYHQVPGCILKEDNTDPIVVRGPNGENWIVRQRPK